MKTQENNVAQEKLVAHSGFITDTRSESVQVSNEPITFGYWFWHGGFMVAVSYILIVWGTAVLIKHFLSFKKIESDKF